MTFVANKQRKFGHRVNYPRPVNGLRHFVVDSFHFRLRNIFNHLSTTPRIRQGLAAHISFWDKCLFIDGYVESLLTTQFKQEGVHVFVAKVQSLKKVKTES